MTSHLGDIITRITGYISSCEHGGGRSAGDRQFLFVNGRPCDHSKLLRVINDTYRSYNKSQYPFVVMDVGLPRGKMCYFIFNACRIM